MATYIQIGSTVTVGSGGAASIDFTSIPSNYTDLKVVVSARSDLTGQDRAVPFIYFNADTSSNANYSYRRIYSIPSIVTGSDSGTGAIGGYINGNSAASTANTFGSLEFYVPNYLGSTQKSISSEGVSEQNSSPAGVAIVAALWNQTAAINGITIKPDSSGNFVANSTATLYGIKNS